MTVESNEPVKIFLFCFSSHPLFSHFKFPIKKNYPMGTIVWATTNISTSRSLEMIGKISLVMWLHFNQSYSKNLSMWDIISTIFSVLVAAHNFQQINEVWWENIMCSYKQTNKQIIVDFAKHQQILNINCTTYRQLRARRALSLFKDVPLKTRRALLLYKVYEDNCLLVINRTSFNHEHPSGS